MLICFLLVSVNKCFVPSDVLNKKAQSRGLSQSQIVQYGLPIRKGFWDKKGNEAPTRQTPNFMQMFGGGKASKSVNKKDALRSELGLDQTLPTVLIVGGGDGAMLQEVCRHPQVRQVTLVEIDPMVIDVCKKHLNMVPNELFDDPRVEIVYADAAKFLQDPTNRNRFDIILADTLDPCGPAESLFEPEFYEAMYAALRTKGLICTQVECM